MPWTSQALLPARQVPTSGIHARYWPGCADAPDTMAAQGAPPTGYPLGLQQPTFRLDRRACAFCDDRLMTCRGSPTTANSHPSARS